MTQPRDATRPRGGLMSAEIGEQPQALLRLLDDGSTAIREVAKRLREYQPRFVLFAARGTSDHAALYAKYLVEITLGLPAGLASPSTMTAYGARPDLTGVLWIAVSQSGGSPDLVDSTAVARECGALTVAVTNAPTSPLADAAEHGVDVLAGPEHAVAATKSYTSQLLALWLLIDAWGGGDAATAHPIPDLAAALIERADATRVAARYRFVERIVTTGRGYAYPTAREAALKLMETSYLSAHSFSGADLLHGPLAMIDEDRPVIAVVPQGTGGAALTPVLDRLRDRGADVCVVGDQKAATGADAVIPLPDGVDERLSPILQIMPLQQLAHTIAVARGYDPDAPRGLKRSPRPGNPGRPPGRHVLDPGTAGHHRAHPQVGVQDHQIRAATGLERAHVVQAERPGRGSRRHPRRRRQRHPAFMHHSPDRGVHSQRAARNRPTRTEPGHAVLDPHIQPAEAVVAIPGAGGRHRIGDQGHPIGPGRRDHVPQHRGVHVHPVRDQLHRHLLILQQRHDWPRFTVVHRTHRVEQVSTHRRAGGQRRAGDLVRGVGVTHRGHRAGVANLPNRGQLPRQLRCHRDHPDVTAAQPQQPRHLGRVRRAQQRRVVRAAVGGTEPRPL